MKSIFISTLLLVSLFCKGQQSSSNSEFDLLNPINLWSVLDDFEYVHVHPDDPYSYTKSTWYKIGEDTTINEIDYKRLLLSSGLNPESWQPSGLFMRQDGDQIYSKDGESQETLLYDFGLAINDSMESEIHQQGLIYISILDSVKETTLNNATRKIYYLTESLKNYSDTKSHEIWIEGIGSITDGLLRQTNLGYTPSSHDYQLLCFHQNENLIYQAKDFDSCFIDIADGISEINSQSGSFKVFPNPTTGQLTIQFDQAASSLPFTVEILSLSGKVIKTENVTRAGQFTVSLSGMPKGIYLICLTTNNHKTVQKLIVK